MDMRGATVNIFVTREAMARAKMDDGAIRVLLVGGDEAAREGLGQILSGAQGIAVIGEVRGGGEALAAARKLCPDVVLIIADVWVLDGSDIDTAQAIAEAQLPAKVVFLAEDVGRYLVPAVRTGAAGLLPRNIGSDELVSSIRKIYRWSSSSIPLQ
jgi:DNA-binding NarL/FixJ family response regulator